ncbi:VOC family protein [Parabacteroides sp. Marseille-P3160]|jgi:glyoxylase I family protein|uniref:VOC family protein n=1 Tax=Parabacteroides sp. Marseille-P3160 TaxID=1917887 RepID=UPI0009BB3FA4|nr:VOC family protein [Parabacteroides sp. Marseille-P3160]
MKTFLGIDHPALAAEDATKLAQWYCEVLGYEIIAQTDKPIYIIKAPDETYIEIMPKDDHERPNRTVCTPGWSHLALRVANLDEAITSLDAHHVNWQGAEFLAVGGGRIRNFLDPEGNLLQIVQR